MTINLKTATASSRLAVILLIAAALSIPNSALRAETGNGVVQVKSAFGVDETVTRLKSDIKDKGIQFFLSIDQSKLGAEAGIAIKPSKLLIFGNPPLGIQFLTSNPVSGLDWPVRVLVTQDNTGQVWVSYTDFHWIASRYGIRDRDAAFKMASEVIASITSSVGSK